MTLYSGCANKMCVSIRCFDFLRCHSINLRLTIDSVMIDIDFAMTIGVHDPDARVHLMVAVVCSHYSMVLSVVVRLHGLEMVMLALIQSLNHGHANYHYMMNCVALFHCSHLHYC